jgi:hypothetical protein
MKLDRNQIAKLIDSSQVYKFSDLATAREFVWRALKPQFILLGDDGRFWVTSAHVAKTLESTGYEITDLL